MSQTHSSFKFIINNLDNLANDELILVIQKAKKLQNDRILPKSALQKLIVFKTTISCPNCGSTNIIRNGHMKDTDIQKYLCKDCKTYFSSLKTIYHSTKKHLLNWEEYLKLLNYELPLATIAAELKMNIKTTFLWRHKIMEALINFDKDIILKGSIWLDEMFIRKNRKGQKNVKKPRSHGKDKIADIIGNSIIIIVAIDDNDNILTIPAGNGKILTQVTAEKLLINKIERKSTIITDDTNAYNTLVTKLNLNRVIYKSCDHSEETLLEQSNINDLCSNIANFFHKMHGIATKYLEQYLALFRFTKKLTYTVGKDTKEKILTFFDETINAKIRYSTRKNK